MSDLEDVKAVEICEIIKTIISLYYNAPLYPPNHNQII